MNTQLISRAIALFSLSLPSITYGIIASDSPSARIAAAASGTFSEAVGRIAFLDANGVEMNYCTGTLLPGGEYILTAAHCDNPLFVTASVEFVVGGSTVTASSSLTNRLEHPLWSAYEDDTDTTVKGAKFQLGRDLALLKLDAPLGSTVPSHDILRDTSGAEIGIGHVRVGFGQAGIGNGNASTRFFDKLERAGWNEYENNTTNVSQIQDFPINQDSFLFYDFDSGSPGNNTFGFGNTGLGTHEVMSAPGDSGGPNLIATSTGIRIAGVVSGGFDAAGFNLPTDSVPSLNSSWGDIGVDTRISALMNQRFIDVALQTGQLLGDSNGDGSITADDVNGLRAAINLGGTPISLQEDIDGDGIVTTVDIDLLVEQVAGTWHGDVNFDGQVDSADEAIVVANFQAPAFNGWIDGDLNGNGFVDIGDFNIVQANNGNGRLGVALGVQGLAATNFSTFEKAVPEPTGSWLAGAAVVYCLSRRTSNCV